MTNSQIHLWQEKAIEDDNLITVGVVIEYPDQTRKNLWYRIPSHYQDQFSSSCDAFVVATIMTAMNHRSNLIVHGSVSPSLLQNLAEYQTAWSCWKPQCYQKVEIIADKEEEQIKEESGQAISAFSGGVDSCFTALRHKMGDDVRVMRNLQAGMMVHGFDIPLSDQEIFNSAVKKSGMILDSIGLDLIPIATNYREVLPLDWEDVYVTAIVSCFMLLHKSYSVGLIGSGAYTYRNLHFPHGCNPVTDSLLSSDSFRVIHDGAGFDRLEKIQAIAEWEAALEHLRVCWEGQHLDKNCGRCEKCIRTVLGFRLVKSELPNCFEQDVTNAQILNLRKLKRVALDELKLILEQARKNNCNDIWIDTLEQCIQNNTQKPPLKKPLSRLLSKISNKIHPPPLSRGTR